MKGTQIGFTAGVIENGIGYIIAEAPGPIMFLSGHADLSEEIMTTRIDQMIDSCGLRPLIKPNTLRKRNSRTGDTNKSKEFAGGSLVSGSASNQSLLRQRSIKYAFIDDFDAVKSSTKAEGSTTSLIEQRLASFGERRKIFYISTPTLQHTSNIEPVYLKGDQRKWHVPCPCCGAMIPWEWSLPLEGEDNEQAGIYWKLDSAGKLIEESVGYVCQKCGGFFTDKDKHDLLNMGVWIPTAEPFQPGYFSYHISALYAPVGMYDWKHYVYKYLSACPPNQPRKEEDYKAFTNTVLGYTYEESGAELTANQLQKNIMNYPIGTVPEKLSQRHGNGNIVLLTCACDLNGTVDDARLDYEIVAWSETGSSYSIRHGSIGTFVPRENTLAVKRDREPWTYQLHKPRSVWPELNKILGASYPTDPGRQLKIVITGIDIGHYENYAWEYMDKSNFYTVGLKGSPPGKYNKYDVNVKMFKPSVNRPHLYLLQSNLVKDLLADMIRLNYDERDEVQPSGFMNFPIPSDGLYLLNNYFSHFEAEHRVTESKDGISIQAAWVKKNSAVQNHLFDCRCYNLALREIFAAQVCKEHKVMGGGWAEYVEIVRKKYL
jgi:phage terminase large subunit GpA-like protein